MSVCDRLSHFSGCVSAWAAHMPGYRAYCHAELTVSSLKTISSTHSAYPQRDDQAESTWMVG